MSKTDYLENNLINHVLRGVTYASPGAIYVALFTVAPTDLGGGTEVAGGSYARQVVTFGAPSTGTTTNDIAVLFPVATADWGTVTSFALMDQVAAGNMLYYANLNASRTVLTSDQLNFPVGQLQVTED